MTDIGSLLENAATLMITGMAAVFLFLTILVFLVSVMARVVPKEEPLPTPRTTSSNTNTSQATSPQIISAISSAVHQYRKRNTK
ncbi:oxaloacetate decarboxylase subunit gamma [Vibrio marisflavi]|uniref:Probable oxaloacetate decarboxylase gamma chain n=1 Tax=Vibrio marisflavi CECT 7928 TaxID=634439 RepID=A0ABN8E4W4_9VIBR|nr:oxaloacetate decarboxylase subunit gamma [Vibrio marisflavi]CAH0538595.1 oxaloacetate decarboxylase gamma chain [Vibrio marisflavi CECT 7928]